MTKSLFVTLAATTLFAAAPAQAQQAYFGATLAPGANWQYRTAPGAPKAEEKVLFGKLYGGYAFDETWAIEGGFGRYEKARFDKADTGAPYTATSEATLVYLAGRASHRFNDKWSVSGKLGAVRHNHRLDHGDRVHTGHDVRPMFGLGASYDLTPHAALTLELNDYGTMRTSEITRKVRKLEAGVKFGF